MPIADVIKYAGEPDTFAWKYPNDEIGTWSQLIVNESQEAVLFKNGKAFDVFEAGRYTLETANIPLLNKIINLPFGGRSIFSAEVWFINKAYQLSIKWGDTLADSDSGPQIWHFYSGPCFWHVWNSDRRCKALFD